PSASWSISSSAGIMLSGGLAAGLPASMPAQSVAKPLLCSEVGQTAAAEQRYTDWELGTRPNWAKQLGLLASQPTITPCLQRLSGPGPLMPQGMPLTARLVPSKSSIFPLQSSSLGLSASQL